MSDYTSVFWSISVPAEWMGREDPECVTFERLAGVGALQISAARKDSLVSDED